MRAFFLNLLRRLRWVLAALAVLLAWARWGPMDPLFTTPRSTVLLDANGELLGAAVADDGQWRMPAGDTIPPRFERCLIEFEDRRFRSHWGVRLPSMVRAWQQNRRAGRTVSGGSTITMQVARMARGDRTRSYGQKLIEVLLALRIELRYSKDEILGLYAANAPFGGNVVGLEAAAWRWYGRAPKDLGWGECATLAVLPNAPARMHPGRNRDALRAKRDRLLDRLLVVHALDSMEWSLAREEPLPEVPISLPQRAPHLLATLQRSGHDGERITSTLNGALQQRVTALLERYAPALRANEVYNAAVLVLDVPTGEVLAYVGNVPSAGEAHAGAVDIVQARRSTGSLLKPFLYADMLQNGELMPDQLVADLPTSYDGFAPRNFEDRYDGAVPASQALARSLNVPAVRELRAHGVGRTLHALRSMGLDHIDRSADDYGLSLVVGGAESTLWELTGAYASMARTVLRYRGEGTVDGGVVHPPIIQRSSEEPGTNDAPPPLSAAALYHTLEAMQQLNRPEAEAGWRQFAGGERIAWKTGTSFGHRDAWAVGVTDRYAVGVWTGNATGEGRPGLTGTLAAAPVLFEVFGQLPDGAGFEPPYDAMEHMAICRASGHRAAVDCDIVDK
ncbi:MAG: penicillin-binding protein 1C, partial [Flavobacteriales bacterium]